MSDGAAKILIVEDEILLQESLKMILQSQGYNVKVAGDGIEAIAELKSFVPDLILLDYFMPRMDGKNFLENVDLSEFPSTKVVVTSNISDQPVVDELLRLGADRYVLKASLSPTELLRLVDEMSL
jgi:CheY-like chemotaxis protein